MQLSYSSVPQPHKPIQTKTLNQADATGNTLAGFLVIFFPSCVVLGAILYKKYRANRVAVLQKQIETLERMWRISPKK
jgi:hypothetical protein